MQWQRETGSDIAMRLVEAEAREWRVGRAGPSDQQVADA
jgi:hypothetical protein